MADAPRRGRRPRNERAATRSIRVPLTDLEFDIVIALARKNNTKYLADMLRLALLEMAAEAGEIASIKLSSPISEHEIRRRPEDRDRMPRSARR
jgi:hypothetical protein